MDTSGLVVHLGDTWHFAEDGLGDIALAAAASWPLETPLPPQLQFLFSEADVWKGRGGLEALKARLVAAKTRVKIPAAAALACGGSSSLGLS